MERVLRSVKWLASLGAAGVLALATPVQAQEDWEFAVFGYLWASGVSGTVETDNRSVDFDTSFSDIVENLDFAAMASFEARKGDWGIITDFMYTNISGSKGTPGPLFSKAEVGLRTIIGTGYIAYRAYANDTVSIDALAAFRVWSMRTKLELTTGILPGQNSSVSDTWVDPVIGARVIVNLDENWFVSGIGDVGGFGVGSELAWQLYGSVNYRFNDQWSAHAGYRYLWFKREFDNLTLDAAYYGPMLGVAYRF